jgi:hypothetical protein
MAILSIPCFNSLFINRDRGVIGRGGVVLGRPTNALAPMSRNFVLPHARRALALQIFASIIIASSVVMLLAILIRPLGIQ